MDQLFERSADRLLSIPGSPLQLPFAHLNLTCNPFGENTLEERVELAVVSVERLVPRLASPGFAVQFFGDRGRGKTTHLIALRERFPGASYVHFPERPGDYSEELDRLFEDGLESNFPLFLDETQRLNRRERRLVFGLARPLVIGTHTDHQWELRRHGYTVKTIRPSDLLDSERLTRILTARIERVRRGPGPIPRVRTETMERLRRDHGTDVRAIEHALYEMFQQLPEVCDV